MADRVFPYNKSVDMGSEIQFQGIDWDDVAASMKNNRFADTSKTQEIIELLAQHDIHLSPNQEDAVSHLVDQVTGESDMSGESNTSQDDLNPDFSRKSEEYTGPSNDNNNDVYDDDDGHMSDPKYHPEMKSSGNNNKMRKIAFTHPSQISAEAVEEALASGDKRLFNTILAARKENRFRIASAIQKQAQTAGGADLGGISPTPGDDSAMAAGPQMGTDAGAGNAYQQGMTAGQAASTNMPPNTKDHTEFMKGFLDALDQKSSGMGAEMASGPDMTGGNPGVDSTMGDIAPTTAFTSPDKFTKAQRTSFKKIAVSLGMPKEYVDAMCGVQQVYLSQDVISLNNKIKEVYSSNISTNTKNSVIQGLVKTAALSPDSKSEFIRFWNELLGYQDKEFWPLVAATYDENGKKKE